ncbi:MULTISPECIES: uracil-DNA glycosylase [unclassified Cyanobium]|uniref:uracil-DNA glycosylase n=1 Tax=unclassified Cyanobium TaxID=2627006 RepID=UPI0020CF5236|nr:MULTISPECIES: uracil-DNA glycosylase [unclassified Cyanobium]
MSPDPTTGADGPGAPPQLPEGIPAPLPQLAAACGQCHRCGLADSRQQVVVGRGNPHARLLLIGEAPGAEEDASGMPFVGRAGKLLEQLLAEAGLDSERDLSIANVIKCRPPGNRKPSRAEIAACLPWLQRQIALQRPQLIGLLGATALEALLGLKGGITKLRGQWLEPLEGSFLSTTETHNFAEVPRQQDQPRSPHQIGDLPNHLPNQPANNPEAINRQTIAIQPSNLKPIALMPLLHPSYLLRNPSGLEGSPKWHTLQDLRLLRRRLDELAAGQG